MSQGDSWLHISFCHHLCLHQLTGSHFCEYALCISFNLIFDISFNPSCAEKGTKTPSGDRMKKKKTSGENQAQSGDQFSYDQ